MRKLALGDGMRMRMQMILGSSPISSALARQWSFVGAPVFVSVFFLSSRVKVVHFKRKVGGGGI